MPESIACPECQKKLRVPEEAIGKRVKCPNCTAVFVAAIDSPPPPPPKKSAAIKAPSMVPARKKPLLHDELEEVDDDVEEEIEERPRRRQRREEEEEPEEDFVEETPSRPKKSAGWRSVRDGVNWVAISLLVAVGLGILTFGIVFLIQMIMRGSKTGFYISTIIAALLGLVSIGINLFGHYKILPIPDRKGISTKTLALVTFIFVCSSAGLTLLSNMISLIQGTPITFDPTGARGASGGWLVLVPNFLSGVCSLSSGITFLLVLRNICLAFGNKGLAKTVFAFLISSLSLILVGIVLSGVFIAIMGVAALGFLNGGQPGVVNPQAQGTLALGVIGMFCFFGLMMVAGLGLFVWYIILLFQVRGVLDKPTRS